MRIREGGADHERAKVGVSYITRSIQDIEKDGESKILKVLN